MMKIQINNFETSIPEDFQKLSNKFKEGIHLSINNDTFNKIIEYGHFYLSLSEEIQKLLLNPQLLSPLNSNDDNLIKWIKTFVSNLEPLQLLDLLDHASKLEIVTLVEICAFEISKIIKGKTADELKIIFNITDSN